MIAVRPPNALVTGGAAPDPGAVVTADTVSRGDLSDFQFDFDTAPLASPVEDTSELKHIFSSEVLLKCVLGFVPWSMRGADLLTVSTTFLADAPHCSADAAYCQVPRLGLGILW